jgi:hypothetical protein
MNVFILRKGADVAGDSICTHTAPGSADTIDLKIMEEKISLFNG